MRKNHEDWNIDQTGKECNFFTPSEKESLSSFSDRMLNSTTIET